MARYRREFLIPYLQNVCALHLAEKKLYEKANHLKRKIGTLQAGQHNVLPPKPPLKPVVTLGRTLSVLLGLCGILGILASLIIPGIDVAIRITFLVSSVCVTTFFLMGAVYCAVAAAKSNRSKELAYERKLMEYERIGQQNQAARQQVPALQTELQRCIAESHRIRNLLKTIYNANIIPRCYRNVYAAVYLYDWFSTSRADDLDLALNMFILDENKENLDQSMGRYATYILGQCISLADQQYAMDPQKYHQLMQAKLDQVPASEEERNAYLSMIESNTAAAAYFSAADYIRRI